MPRQPLVVDIDVPQATHALWEAGLGQVEPGTDVAAVVRPYRLTEPQAQRALSAARGLAALDGTAVTEAHIRRAVREVTALGMGPQVRHIEPAASWRDLVLPAAQLGHLRELALRVRYRERVLGDWRMRVGGGRGHGVVAVFAGDPGTGKTLAAEVVAAELGLDLYVVELSTVADKYVGETEKNLERIFAQADRVNGLLLFDEADAVFGRRSEATDAHDRYANMQSAYLLQRLESFDGVAVLTTNLRANIDDAFTRRFDLVVDFPFPDRDQRRALWELCLSDPLPRGDDIDTGRCAREFELAGGGIRSAVTTAAYLAAAEGRPVAMADLLTGASREYRKLGRLVSPDGTTPW
jgi:hypothetical protein